MRTKKQPPAAPVGAVFENVHIENNAASVPSDAAAALGRAADAAAENARAISAIAKALQGAPATMTHDFHLSNVRGSD